MLGVLGDSMVAMVHMISHRYAVSRESPRDRLTYHSVCLLEWVHGSYCTVVESAFLNGIVSLFARKNGCRHEDIFLSHVLLFCVNCRANAEGRLQGQVELV